MLHTLFEVSEGIGGVIAFDTRPGPSQTLLEIVERGKTSLLCFAHIKIGQVLL